MSQTLTVMAIDPGYDRVGWAMGKIQGIKIVGLAYGLIQTATKSDRIARYQQIDTELSAIIQKYQPVEVAIETLFFSKNVSTAIHVAEARGVIISSLFRHSVAVTEYNPVAIKQAVTGYGQADKKAMKKMVVMQLKKFLVADLEPIIDDTLDAMGVLLTHITCRTSHSK